MAVNEKAYIAVSEKGTSIGLYRKLLNHFHFKHFFELNVTSFYLFQCFSWRFTSRFLS